MAKLVFTSDEARDHFKKVVAASIDAGTYFGEKGLNARLDYLQNYVDEGKDYKIVTEEGGGVLCGRKAECRLGLGYNTNEINLTMYYADRERGEFDFGEWKMMWVGGLIGHDDGQWLVHT